MREHSSGTGIGRKAVDLLKTLRRLWDDGVRANEALLSGPWDREGPLRWRRRRGGWSLDGAMPPLAPLDPPREPCPDQGGPAGPEPDEPGRLSPRS